MKVPLTSLALLAAVTALRACGIPGNLGRRRPAPTTRGAVIFREHCSGCHTLAVVGAEGSATSISNRLKTNGPNFNFRKEKSKPGALRDPQRRLLRRDHAREHRRRRTGAGGREFLAAYSGLQRQKVPFDQHHAVDEIGSRRRRLAACSTCSASGRNRTRSRAALARRDPRLAAAARAGDRARRAPARAAPRAGGPARRAERGDAGIRAATDAGRARARDRRRCGRWPRAPSSSSGELAEVEEPLCRRRSRRCRTCPTRPRRPGPRTSSCARWASRAARLRAARSPRARGRRIDMDRGANLSGSRFAYLRGDLVMLELALVRWALEKLRGHGFEPVIPPVLVRERALYGTGFLPDTEQQIYSLPEDELYLVGTSEVALASLHDEEILDAEHLPLRYAGSRRASAARRAQREGHARHLPRAPVRQGRDVQLRRARGVGGGARADPRDRAGDPRPSSSFPTAS